MELIASVEKAIFSYFSSFRRIWSCDSYI